MAVIVYLFMLSAVGKISFAWECVGPDDSNSNCLQCHIKDYIHLYHLGTLGITDCTECHCGEYLTSPCDWGELEHEPVETVCCTICHTAELTPHYECSEVIVHTNRVENGYDCGQCHFQPGDPGDCPVAIPTLSEWGIIIFITIIIGIGVSMIIRKRRMA